MATVPIRTNRSRMPSLPRIRGAGEVSADDIGGGAARQMNRFGEAVQGVGDAAMRFGLDLERKQEEAKSNLEETAYIERVAADQNRISLLKGPDAFEARKLVEESQKRNREIALKNLESPMAKEMFERAVHGFDRDARMKADAFVVEETERTRIVSLDEKNGEYQALMAADPGDRNNFYRALTLGRDNIAKKYQGEPEELVRNEQRKYGALVVERYADALAKTPGYGPEAALAFLETGVKDEFRDDKFLLAQFNRLKPKYLQETNRKLQEALERDMQIALARGASEQDLMLLGVAMHGHMPKLAMINTAKKSGVSDKEAREFADGQYMTDAMEKSVLSIVGEAYQGKGALTQREADTVRLRLAAEAGVAPELAERIIAMPRVKLAARNRNDVRSGFDEFSGIRKAIAEAGGDIQGTDLWNGLSEQRQTLVLAMQERMERGGNIDELAQAKLFGQWQARRDSDAGEFYQWLNDDARLMMASIAFADKPEMMQALLASQPIDPESVPSRAMLSMEAGNMMAGTGALGKELDARITRSVDGFMVSAKKPERDAVKTQIREKVVGDLLHAAKIHKTGIGGLSPLVRNEIINDGMLRYMPPNTFVPGYGDPVYGQSLTAGQREESRIDPASLPVAERSNLTAPGGIVTRAASPLPGDAGALVRMETDVDLLRTPDQVRARIQNVYGLRNDLIISQQLDAGVFVVIPPQGRGMLVARDGSVVGDVPEATAAAMRPAPGGAVDTLAATVMDSVDTLGRMYYPGAPDTEWADKEREAQNARALNALGDARAYAATDNGINVRANVSGRTFSGEGR